MNDRPSTPRTLSERLRVGTFQATKIGAARFDWRDPYHLALTLPWPWFLLAVLAVYLAINVLFALLYLVDPDSIANARPHVFGDAFFFSIETLATVGYGVRAPSSTYGHVIASTELIVGMAFTAIMTGLFFVRFSRPRAKFLFPEQVVVTPYNGTPTLMIRIGNGRMNVLTGARAHLTALLRELSPEGQSFRRVHDMRLLRAHNPLFPLTWTLMHPIDAESPLAGHTEETLRDADIRLFLAVEARDHALAATVHDLGTYGADEIRFGMRYTDAVSSGADGNTVADLTRLSLIEPSPL